MSRIIPGSLGTPIGKHGKVVYRRNKRKIFSYEITDDFKGAQSERAKANRENFGILVKFSNFVNKSVLFKKIWRKSRQPGSATNRKILKYNSNTFKHAKINSGIHILPKSMNIHNAGVFLDDNNLMIKFTTYDNNAGFDEKYADFNSPYVIAAIIHAKDPVNSKIEKKFANLLLEETLEIEQFTRDGFITFTFDTPDGSFKFINDYNTVLVFPAIISIDQYNSPLKWAECGGIYIKGERPKSLPHEPDRPVEKPGKTFLLEYS